MRYAIIENDRVANIVLADPEFAAGKGWIECGDDVAIGHIRDGETFAPYVQPVDDRKADMRAAVNREKMRRQGSVAQTPAGPVDCDTDSRNKLNGAVLMAMLAAQAGQPFAITWTLADNSNDALDGPGLIGMATAVGRYVAACHAHAQTLKAAIDGAEDHAALDAVDIAAGWP